MACVWKHPESKFWIARFTDHTGQQRNRSTRETVRKAAQRRADFFEEAYQRMRSQTQARKVLSEIYEEINGERLSTASARAYFSAWLQRREAEEIAAASLKRYRQVLERFELKLGDNADKDLSFISREEIQSFRDELTTSLSPASANIYLKILRMVLQDAWRDGLLLENVAAKVRTIRNKRNPEGRRPFTLPELKRLLDKADIEWRGIILTGLYTGQRLGDICRLIWRSVDLKKAELAISTEKTGRRVILPIAKPLLSHYLNLPSTDDPTKPLFPRAFTTATVQGRTGSLSNQFFDLLVSAGLATKRTHKAAEDGEGRSGKRQTNPLSFHCIRHTATSLLKNAGVSEAVAMDIIGHESRSISDNYTHIEESAKRAALDALPDLTS